MTNVLACDAILFDLDGVLIDSTPAILRLWQKWADRHGLDGAAIMQESHGVRATETIRKMAPHVDVGSEAAWLVAQEIADTDGVTAMPGARDLLLTLPDDVWTVVTSGNREPVAARLRAAGLPLPRRIVTADDVTQGKPAPEPYLLGAQRLGVAPVRCLVVEDAPAGIQAGCSAGIRVLGIAATYTAGELLAAGATAVADRLSDLTVERADDGHRLVVRWG